MVEVRTLGRQGYRLNGQRARGGDRVSTEDRGAGRQVRGAEGEQRRGRKEERDAVEEQVGET